eukprot:scaffold289388_cov24-Attheya_sp.AAC.1
MFAATTPGTGNLDLSCPPKIPGFSGCEKIEKKKTIHNKSEYNTRQQHSTDKNINKWYVRSHPKFTSSPLLAWRAGIMIRRRRGR